MTDLIWQPSITISHARADLAAACAGHNETTKVPNNMHIFTPVTLPDKRRTNTSKQRTCPHVGVLVNNEFVKQKQSEPTKTVNSPHACVLVINESVDDSNKSMNQKNKHKQIRTANHLHIGALVAEFVNHNKSHTTRPNELTN